MKPNKTCKYLLLSALLLTIAGAPAVQADTTDEEIQQLREQLQLLSQRLDQLEQDNQSLRAANEELAQTSQENAAAAVEANEKADTAVAQVAELSEQESAGSWADTLAWSGDFRYRYERIAVGDDPTRTRSRIRARAHLSADIYDDMTVGIGLASGSDDPVSSNQTLGGGGSTKPLSLDLAYFDWTGLKDTHVMGGKFKNNLQPVGKNSMLFDSDWRPEGFSVAYENSMFFADGIGTWLESDSKAGDSFAWIAEAGLKFKLGESTKLRFGAGYQQINAAGSPSFFGDGDFFGNSFDPVTMTYLYDYHVLDLFAELDFELFSLPTQIYADAIQNQAADEFNNGYIFGINLGKAKARGSWALGYAYEDLEADAALGLLVDSDFGGGGTDAKGHIFKGTYAIRDNFNAKFTYFVNKINGNIGEEEDFDRLMLDLNFKF